MEEWFLIESKEHPMERGHYRVWWKPNRLGYTIDIDHAGRYSRKEATEICDKANQGLGAEDPNEVMWNLHDVLEGLAGPIRRVVSQ